MLLAAAWRCERSGECAVENSDDCHRLLRVRGERPSCGCRCTAKHSDKLASSHESVRIKDSAERGCHRPPQRRTNTNCECDLPPTDGSSCRLLNGDFGASHLVGSTLMENGPLMWALLGRMAMGKPHIFRCPPSLFSPLHTTHRSVDRTARRPGHRGKASSAWSRTSMR
jgi:hypothetical protein